MLNSNLSSKVFLFNITKSNIIRSTLDLCILSLILIACLVWNTDVACGSNTYNWYLLPGLLILYLLINVWCTKLHVIKINYSDIFLLAFAIICLMNALSFHYFSLNNTRLILTESFIIFYYNLRINNTKFSQQCFLLLLSLVFLVDLFKSYQQFLSSNAIYGFLRNTGYNSQFLTITMVPFIWTIDNTVKAKSTIKLIFKSIIIISITPIIYLTESRLAWLSLLIVFFSIFHFKKHSQKLTFYVLIVSFFCFCQKR